MSVHKSSDYHALLENWLTSSLKEIYTPAERPDLACYGTGYNSWGVQTNQKALAAWGIIATSPDFGKNNTGLSRKQAIDYALQMLRFSLESHIEGSYQCTDGQKWGHTWISALGIERMMHGVDALEEYMTHADKALLEKVLISESNWLLDHYEVVADPDATTGKNKPESNLWNGALLFRTAMMFPNAHRADEYKEKGISFLINSISVPSDRQCSSVIHGKPVAQWHVGSNFFESYALHHHGYLNVGYMVICLSNIAMLHFFCKKRNLTAPPALYHHAYDLWKLIKMCTFPDGRLCRIGGDTRARYCYCQDYALPMWLFMIDYYDEEDCLVYEKGWLEIVKNETEVNGDGSFLSERGQQLKEESPLYYTRLESDRAVTLSMAAYWRTLCHDKNSSNSPATKKQAAQTGQWHDTFHGACLQRGKNRIASWVWESAEKPQGMCLPSNRSDLAEWRTNLVPLIAGTGEQSVNNVTSHSETLFEGGFITKGSVDVVSTQMLAEGRPDEIIARQLLVYVALPDDTTSVCLQYAKTASRVYIKSLKGLNLAVPNDIFNSETRHYASADGSTKLIGGNANKKTIHLKSNWLNIDNCLSVIALYGGNISIARPQKRQIYIKNKKRGGGFLYVDEICCPYHNKLTAYDANELLIDTGFAIQAGVAADTAVKTATNNHFYAFPKKLLPRDVRAVMITGADQVAYLLIANFGNEKKELQLDTKQKGTFVNMLNQQSILIHKNKLIVSCLPGSVIIGTLC